MMFEFLGMIGNYEQRKIANDKVDGGVVSTAAVNDSDKPYETGICHPSYDDGNWVTVELYDTMEQAKIGHKKWCEILASKPEALTDNGSASCRPNFEDGENVYKRAQE